MTSLKNVSLDAVGAGGGGLAGAKAGAFAGSLFGPIGTLIGSIVVASAEPWVGEQSQMKLRKDHLKKQSRNISQTFPG
jgi:phage tail tape-measure protein